MLPRWILVSSAILAVLISGAGAQTTPKRNRSATREIASGAGNIGKGAAKGASHLAVGTAKSAADLATLHPIDAASSLGRGAGSAAKDVTVGAVKGTAKMTAGVGRAIGKIF